MTSQSIALAICLLPCVLSAAIAQDRAREAGGTFDKLLRFDRNRDGQISRDEAPQQLKQFFARIDRNSDGFIDRNEMKMVQLRQDQLNQGRGKVNISGLLTDLKMRVDGEDREYHLFVPDKHENSPVVLLFHGHGNNANELLGLSGDSAPQAYFKVWLDIARKDNVILAVPNGRYRSKLEKGWNDCRSDAFSNSKADDVQFIRLLIEHIKEKYQVNPKRIYATGHSNGAHFCIRLAQEMPDKLAAFAAISGANSARSKCEDSDVPISAMFMNGTIDPLLPYEGGGIRGRVYSAEETIEYWVKRNGTDQTAKVIKVPDINKEDNCHVEKYLYAKGTDDTEVILVKIVNGGHPAPSIKVRNSDTILNRIKNQNADIEMADEVWAFFKNKSR